MRVVIQRVCSASVTVNGEIVGQIGKGALVLVGLGREDTPKQVEAMIKKILNVRLWSDPANESRTWSSGVVQNNFEILYVSQFTLFGQLKGYKPDFHNAMGPSEAKQMYEDMVEKTKRMYVSDRVKSGIFAADMLVELQNDGPVTLILESPQEPSSSKPKPKEESKAEVKQEDESAANSEPRLSKHERRMLRKAEATANFTNMSASTSTDTDLTSTANDQIPFTDGNNMENFISSPPYKSSIAVSESHSPFSHLGKKYASGKGDQPVLVEGGVQILIESTPSEFSALAVKAPTMIAETEAPSVLSIHDAKTDIFEGFSGASKLLGGNWIQTQHAVAKVANDDGSIAVFSKTKGKVDASGINSKRRLPQEFVDKIDVPMTVGESQASNIDPSIASSIANTATVRAEADASVSQGSASPSDSPNIMQTHSVGFPEVNEQRLRRMTSGSLFSSLHDPILVSSASEAAFPNQNATRIRATARDETRSISQEDREFDAYKSIIRQQALDLAQVRAELQEVKRMVNNEKGIRDRVSNMARSIPTAASLDTNVGASPSSVAAMYTGVGAANSLVGADFVVTEGDAEIDDDGDESHERAFQDMRMGRRATDARTVHDGREVPRRLALNGEPTLSSSSAVFGHRAQIEAIGEGGQRQIANTIGDAVTEHTDVHPGDADRDTSQAPMLMFDSIEVRSSAPHGLVHGHGLARSQAPLSVAMPLQLASAGAQVGVSYVGTRPRASSEAGSVGSSGSGIGLQVGASSSVRPSQPLRTSGATVRSAKLQSAHQQVRGEPSHILHEPGSARMRTKASTLTKALRRSGGLVSDDRGGVVGNDDVDDDGFDVISIDENEDMVGAMISESVAEPPESSFDLRGESRLALKSNSFHQDIAEDIIEMHGHGPSDDDHSRLPSQRLVSRRRDDEGRSEHGLARRTNNRKNILQSSTVSTQSLSGFILPRNATDTQYIVNQHISIPSHPDERSENLIDVTKSASGVPSTLDEDMYRSGRGLLHGVTEPAVSPTSTASFESSRVAGPGTELNSSVAYPQRFPQNHFPVPSKAHSEVPAEGSNNETRERINALRELILPAENDRNLDENIGFAGLRSQEVDELNSLLERLKILISTGQHSRPTETQSNRGVPLSPYSSGVPRYQRYNSHSSLDNGDTVSRSNSVSHSPHLQTSMGIEKGTSRDQPHHLSVRTSSPHALRGLNSPPPAPGPPRTPRLMSSEKPNLSLAQQNLESILTGVTTPYSHTLAGTPTHSAQSPAIATVGTNRNAAGASRRSTASYFSPSTRHRTRQSMDDPVTLVEGIANRDASVAMSEANGLVATRGIQLTRGLSGSLETGSALSLRDQKSSEMHSILSTGATQLGPNVSPLANQPISSDGFGSQFSVTSSQ